MAGLALIVKHSPTVCHCKVPLYTRHYHVSETIQRARPAVQITRDFLITRAGIMRFTINFCRFPDKLRFEVNYALCRWKKAAHSRGRRAAVEFTEKTDQQQ